MSSIAERFIPDKLQKGDTVRVVAPSWSLSLIDKDRRELANKKLEKIGLVVTFGEHVEETDIFNSSSVDSRVEDVHQAFLDPQVKAILTVIGGYNSNQLLQHLDWDIIKRHPKIFCGFSDIDVLNNAIYAKTGLVTYSGPLYSSFSQKLYFEYTKEYFEKCLMSNEPFTLIPNQYWSDDEWYKDQEKRQLVANEGNTVIHEGEATGIVVGTNLCTINILQGTEFFPDLEGVILFLEDDYLSPPSAFDRNLQSLVQQKKFAAVNGLVFGRFQKKSGMTNDLLRIIIESKRELKNMPIIASANFGHTDPKATIPIGGITRINAIGQHGTIEFLEH
ncbi:MAG: LD-carboxypeptidase [Candidatus Levybacteria bacterium]|nr:LD-carboxypeptidase [Candidatus Levybacteria bacterium]